MHNLAATRPNLALFIEFRDAPVAETRDSMKTRCSMSTPTETLAP